MAHIDNAALLPAPAFAAAVAALPLVSLDWVLTNPDGQLLLGQRLNAPARGWWFTPGGRIRKNEALAHALQRVACDELGLAPQGGITLNNSSVGNATLVTATGATGGGS